MDLLIDITVAGDRMRYLEINFFFFEFINSYINIVYIFLLFNYYSFSFIIYKRWDIAF